MKMQIYAIFIRKSLKIIYKKQKTIRDHFHYTREVIPLNNADS